MNYWYNNMGEYQTHYANWKKLNKKGFNAVCFLFYEYLERANLEGHKIRALITGSGVEDKDWLQKSTGRIEIVYIMMEAVVAQHLHSSRFLKLRALKGWTLWIISQ